MKKLSYHVNPLISKREEELHIAHMQRRINQAKGTIPKAKGRKPSKSQKPPAEEGYKVPEEDTELDEAIRERLSDLLGHSLIKNIQHLVKMNMHGDQKPLIPSSGSHQAPIKPKSKPPKPPTKQAPVEVKKKVPRPQWKDDWTDQADRDSVQSGKDRTSPNLVSSSSKRSSSSSSPSRRPPSAETKSTNPTAFQPSVRSASPYGSRAPIPASRLDRPSSNERKRNSNHELLLLARLGAKPQFAASEGGQSMQEEIDHEDEAYEDDFEELSDGEISNLGRVALSDASNADVSDLKNSIAFVNSLIQLKIHRLTQDDAAPEEDACLMGELVEDENDGGDAEEQEGEREPQPELDEEFEVPASPAEKHDLRSEARHLFQSLRTLKDLVSVIHEDNAENEGDNLDLLSPKDRLAGDVEWLDALMQNLSGSLQLNLRR